MSKYQKGDVVVVESRIRIKPTIHRIKYIDGLTTYFYPNEDWDFGPRSSCVDSVLIKRHATGQEIEDFEKKEIMYALK